MLGDRRSAQSTWQSLTLPSPNITVITEFKYVRQIFISGRFKIPKLKYGRHPYSTERFKTSIRGWQTLINKFICSHIHVLTLYIKHENFNILSRVRVTIYRFWIDNWIYWTFLQLVTTLVTQRLVFSVTLLSNGFECLMFLSFRAHVLAG
jgi:hypothetical protein